MIKQGLADLGINCVVPAMPGGLRPHCEDWVNVIKNGVGGSDDEVILVGHSLGTAAILLYLEHWQPKNIEAVVLFAAIDPSWLQNREKVGGNIADFICSVDYGKIKKFGKTFIVSSSKDDPIVEFAQGKMLSEKLGADFLPVRGMGHFKGEETTDRDAAYFLSIIKTVLR
jgi:predicted alpha/beta hydrolase family esterase